MIMKTIVVPMTSTTSLTAHAVTRRQNMMSAQMSASTVSFELGESNEY